MHPHVYQFLRVHKDLLNFVRKNPIWYRYLSRDPDQISKLIKASKLFYGKTFHQRAERISNQIKMLHMLMQLTKGTDEKE